MHHICIIGSNQTTLMILLGNPVFTWQLFLLPRLIISNHSSKTQLAKEKLHPSHTWNIDAWCCGSLGSVSKIHDYPPWKLSTVSWKLMVWKIKFYFKLVPLNKGTCDNGGVWFGANLPSNQQVILAVCIKKLTYGWTSWYKILHPRVGIEKLNVFSVILVS